MGILVHWLALSIAIFLVARVVPGVRLKGFGTGVAVAAVYGVINLVVGLPLRIVLGFLSLPLTLLTLGLFRFVVGLAVNALVLWLTDRFFEDFEVEGFGSLLAAAAGISLVSSLLTSALT